MQAVLAQRQIRKAKRPIRGDSADSASSATSNSNPFASVALVPGGAAPGTNAFASVNLVAGGAPAAAAGSFSCGAPAAIGGFGAAAAAPAPAPAATFGAPAGGFGSFGGFGGFGAGAAAAPAPALSGFSFGGAAASTPAPLPAASVGFGFGAAAAPAPTAAATPAPTPAPATKPADAAPPASVEDLKALNAEFLEHLENEWQRGSRCTDWSEAVQQYLDQREALATVGGRSSTANGASTPAATPPAPMFGTAAPAPAPMFGTAAPASAPGGFAFGGGAAAPPAFGTVAPPAFGGFSFTGIAAPPVLPTLGGFGAPAPAAPAPAPAAKPVMASAPLPTASGEGDAVAKHKCVCKVSVFRQEKKNDQGELIQEKGWKPIGTGQLRLLFDDGVHFVEFRPVVQDGTAAEDAEGGGSDEMIGQKKYGRPVLTARLAATTKFEVNNKAVQVNLSSTDAAGQPVYARYNINIGGVAEAAEFGALANSLCPKA